MGLLRLVLHLFRAVRFLFRAVVVSVVTVVGWLVVQDLVRSGELPPEPLGLAAMGLPATLFGIPTVYAGGIVLFAGLLLFGERGGGSSTGGFDAGHAGGFDGGGGGFGDGGGGAGGDGGGGGGGGGGGSGE